MKRFALLVIATVATLWLLASPVAAQEANRGSARALRGIPPVEQYVVIVALVLPAVIGALGGIALRVTGTNDGGARG